MAPLFLPDCAMENHKLILPEHLNHYGHLFGGNMLKWVDEYAWIAATLDYPGCDFVTIGMDRVEFRKGVKEGAILAFRVERVSQGRTSVSYGVEVFHKNSATAQERVFSTQVTFVNVNKEGNKIALP